MDEAKKLIEKKNQQTSYAKSIRIDYQQKSAFQAQQSGHGTGKHSSKSKKESSSSKKETEDQEACHYCGYCDQQGHFKSNCRTFKEHEAKGCIREDWLNKPDSERRCTFCQIKGHRKDACKIKKEGKERGDYNSKRGYKKATAAVATKAKDQEADDGQDSSKHYGFVIVDEHKSEDREECPHTTNILSFSIEENTGQVVATGWDGSIRESKIADWIDEIVPEIITADAIKEQASNLGQTADLTANNIDTEIKREYIEETSEIISVEALKDVDEVTCATTEASDSYAPITKYDEHQVTVLLIPGDTTETEHVYIERDKKVVESKDLIILDTGATVSIFCNPLLVSDIRDVTPIYITGIAPQKVKISKMGRCDAIYGINVYVDTNIHINIVSFAVLDKLVRIERTQSGFSCGSIVWSLVDNLYIFSLACDCAQLKRDVFMLTNVEKRAELEQRALTRKERFLNNIERFLERMGISPTMLKQIIKYQTIKGLAFTEADVDHLITKYGSSLAYQSSRAKHQKQNVKLQLYDEIPDKVITLFCDLFKIYNRWFCLVVCSHIKAYHCIPITGRGEIELNRAIVTILRVIRNQGWNSRVLYIDGEKALNVTNSLENLEGLRVIKMPGTHVGEAEVGVRIIKERVWYRHGLLQFNLVVSLVEHIVNCMTRMINASPKEIDGRITSSREYITGHAVHADQMKFSFGDLVGAYVGGTEERRYKPALVLYPTFEADNSYILLDITPNKKGEIGRINIIKTGSVSKIEWSAELKYAIESMGYMVNKNELIEDLEELDPEAVENISNIAVQGSLIDLVLDEKVKCRDVFVGDKTTDKMSFDQALKLYPHLVKEAVESELNGFLETDAIEPIDNFVSDPIRSFGFFKVKRDAVTGEVIKLKYRLVINGKVKRLSGFYETFDRDFAGYTPSWTNTAAYMSINAAKGKHFMLMDVKQAYLQTENNLGHHMVLSKQETAVLIKLKPEWARYVRKNGEILVKVKKSIYGLKESGRLWYEEFVKRATEYPGVKVNPVDVCFMGNGSLGMCVYVDDNLVCGTLDELQGFRTHMEKYFGDMVCSKVDDFAYLGMHVTIIGGKVELKADVYCKKLVADNSSLIKKEYNTPCNKDLFIETEPETELSQKLKEQFHSVVASLLYIAIRVRLDILLAVVYLATRVHNTTQQDVDKLSRVLGYLKKYPTRHMILKVDDPTNLVMRAYADASYGIYSQGRNSQTGIFVTLGIGCIIGKSVKQKLTAVSSTESEITALSQMVRMVLGLIQFLEAQGENVENMKVILFEDNSSAIQMIKNGRALSEGTKHISIHKFFIKQHLTPEGKLELRQCTTIEQIANGFTKPLSLNEFIRFLVDIGMKVVDAEDNGKSKSITLLHDGTGVLYLVQIDIASENLFSVHFMDSDLGSVFEGPVPNKTANESVATSYISERKDYSNSEGRRLLAHINSSINESNDAETAFVAGRSQESRGGKTDESSTNNLVQSSREEKQKATAPVLVKINNEHSSSADLTSSAKHLVDNY